MNKKREIYSDILKIVSIFLVIVIHVIAFYRDKYFFINHKYYFFLTFIDSFTRVAVPIFFMITGTFMLSKKTDNYVTYLKKRIPKLFIPFFIISFIYYIYECSKSGFNISITNFLIMFLSNNIKYHFWYMYAIILIYTLIPFLQVLVQNIDRRKTFQIIIVLFILTNIFGTISSLTSRYNHGILGEFTLPSMFAYINCLLIGHYLHTYELTKQKKNILFIGSIICICMMPIADHFFINGYRNDQMLVVTSAFPIIPSISTYVFFKDLFNNNDKYIVFTNIITRIASVIIYIYMIHVLVLELFERLLSKFWVCNSFFEDLLRIGIVSIMTFIISLAISYLITRVKELLVKLISKIKKK